MVAVVIYSTLRRWHAQTIRHGVWVCAGVFGSGSVSELFSVLILCSRRVFRLQESVWML